MKKKKMQLLVTLAVLLAAGAESFRSLGSGLRRKFRGQQRHQNTRLNVVEHLADCVGNPLVAEAYGGLQSEFCYQTNGINVQDIGALVGQVAFMGLVVSTYFLFKRNGLAEILGQDLAAVEPNPFERSDGNNNGVVDVADKRMRMKTRTRTRAGQRRKSLQCPQCGGSGMCDLGGGMGGADTCDLCDGSGSVPYTRKASMPRLPRNSN